MRGNTVKLILVHYDSNLYILRKNGKVHIEFCRKGVIFNLWLHYLFAQRHKCTQTKQAILPRLHHSSETLDKANVFLEGFRCSVNTWSHFSLNKCITLRGAFHMLHPSAAYVNTCLECDGGFTRQ